MLLLDLDWLGSLIFLWFIFKGFKNSKAAKRKHEERRRKEPSAQRDIKPQPSPQTRRQVRPEPKQEPAPSWFPFELPKWENDKQEPKKTAKKAAETKQPKQSVNQVYQQPKVERPAKTAAILQEQEQLWKNENYTFDLDKKAVVNGIIWSEILGPPRAKNKYRR